MKYIRECRMGAPKAFKTGAVVGTYPKPMLYLGFDRGGIDVIPPAATVIPPTFIQPDVRYEEIERIRPGQMPRILAQSPQPKVVAADYTVAETMSLSLDMLPGKATKPFNDFVSDYNVLAAFINSGKPLPFKTLVFDSITGYEDMILGHIASVNAAAMDDARKWASQVGGKVRQTILTMTTWPCHVVVLMHSALDTNELTNAVRETPSVFSKGLRSDISGLFSQFFFATKTMLGMPVVWTSDKLYVSGVGPRWPIGLPQECQPDFKSIYGKEAL